MNPTDRRTLILALLSLPVSAAIAGLVQRAMPQKEIEHGGTMASHGPQNIDRRLDRLADISNGGRGEEGSRDAVVLAVGRSGERLSRQAVRSERYTVTAYCPCSTCCGRWADGITASGRPVTANGGRFVAAPKDIPFGTMVHVPGYGTVPVFDRGGAIRGNRLDVFFPDHRQALKWGRQNLMVTIYTKGTSHD